MITTLPPPNTLRVVARPVGHTESALARSDGVVLLIERGTDAVARLEALPFGATWRALLEHERRAGNEWPVLVTRLPNRRHTLAAVGFVKPHASGFERLDLAGKLAKEIVRPGVTSLQLHGMGFGDDSDRDAALESALCAVLAHAAPMPEHKSSPTPPAPLTRVEVAAATRRIRRPLRRRVRRQPPCALARHVAAQRARHARLSQRPAAARASAKAGNTSSSTLPHWKSCRPGRSSPSPARIRTAARASRG